MVWLSLYIIKHYIKFKMCYSRLQHFVHIILSLFILCSTFFNPNIGSNSSISNKQKQVNKYQLNMLMGKRVAIKHLEKKEITSNSLPMSKDINENKNFAEGGIIFSNDRTFKTETEITSLKKLERNLSSLTIHMDKNNSSKILPIQKIDSVMTKQEILQSDTSNPLTQFQYNETGANLFLGVPEVVHLNGTSSVKPRKGVYYNKLELQKELEKDNIINPKFLTNNSCFWISDNLCYNAFKFSNIDCSCCEKGNYLGKLIQQQPLLNCSSCQPLEPFPLGQSNICQNICCKNTLFNKNSSILTSTNSEVKTLNLSDLFFPNQKQTLTELQKIEMKKIENQSFEHEFKEEIKLSTLKKKFKPKPSITKVPYDVETVTKLLGRNSKNVIVPLVISFFLIPIAGIIIFLLWKKSKEYWDKRYYKRIDFLIDGIYND